MTTRRLPRKMTAIRRARHRRLWLRFHKSAESRLYTLVARYFRSQASGIVEKVEDEILELEELIDVDDATAELVEIAEPQLRRSAVTAAEEEIAAFLLDEVPAEVLAGARAEITRAMASPHWQAIAETTRDTLARAIEEGIAEKQGLEDIVTRVQAALGPSATNARARRIAITESTGAINAGRHAARQDLIEQELITGIEWVTVQDSRTRQTHSALDGTVVGAGELFDVGGTDAPYPGWYGLPAEQRVNCRCTSVASASFADEE